MPDKFTLIKEIFKINDKIINLIKLLFNNSLKEIKHNDHIFKEAVYSKTSRDFVSHPQINSTLMYNNKVYGSSSVSTHSYPYTDINNTVNVYPSAVYNTSINGFNKKQYWYSKKSELFSLENEVNNNVIVDNMYKQHDGVIKNILNSDINHTIIQNKYKTHIVTHSDPFYEIPLNKETYINIEERKALIIEDTVNKIMNELNSYDTMDLSFIREIVNKAFR